MKLTKSELVEARDWLLDCCVDHYESCYISECSDEEIEELVAKKYSGGLDGFLDSFGPNYKREEK